MSSEAVTHFIDMSGGMDPTQFIEKLENEPNDVARIEFSQTRNFSDCLMKRKVIAVDLL